MAVVEVSLSSRRAAIRPMPRITLIAASLALAASLAGSSRLGLSALGPAPRVTVIYVGAEDCAPCRIWHRDYWPPFRGSPEFKRLSYREVKSPNLFEVLKDERWPGDLQGYRKYIKADSGVPFWLVVADDEMVLTASGLSEWEASVLPAIKWLAR